VEGRQQDRTYRKKKKKKKKQSDSQTVNHQSVMTTNNLKGKEFAKVEHSTNVSWDLKELLNELKLILLQA
jgi:translation initiation factor 1 (eIF-1/SUI1)